VFGTAPTPQPAAERLLPEARETREAILRSLPTELTRVAGELDLRACMQAFAAPELLEGDDAYECEVCQKRGAAATPPVAVTGSPALKWLQIVKPPPVLTIHLKRFRSLGSFIQKLSTDVPFPPQLDLRPFCGSEAPPASLSTLGERCSADFRYDLCGVVEHSGNFTSGHYRSFVRVDDGEWQLCNDSVVSPATEGAALGSEAFLLFYCLR